MDDTGYPPKCAQQPCTIDECCIAPLSQCPTAVEDPTFCRYGYVSFFIFMYFVFIIDNFFCYKPWLLLLNIHQRLIKPFFFILFFNKQTNKQTNKKTNKTLILLITIYLSIYIAKQAVGPIIDGKTPGCANIECTQEECCILGVLAQCPQTTNYFNLLDPQLDLSDPELVQVIDHADICPTGYVSIFIFIYFIFIFIFLAFYLNYKPALTFY